MERGAATTRVRAPATLFAASSCPPGAWSIESLPPRAVRRSSPTSCVTRRGKSSRSAFREFTLGRRSWYKVALGLGRGLVRDAVAAEGLNGPFARIPIPINLRDPVALKNVGGFALSPDGQTDRNARGRATRSDPSQ